MIKKYSMSNGYRVIKTNSYNSSFDHISGLVKIAKEDFPDLRDTEISIKVYRDSHWNRQVGIEFYREVRTEDRFNGEVDNGYILIGRLPEA